MTLLIADNSTQIVLTPESEIEKTFVNYIKKGELIEATVSQISFSENKNGILRDTAEVNSLIVKIQ